MATFEERSIEREQEQFERAGKRQRSRDDTAQCRLIIEKED